MALVTTYPLQRSILDTAIASGPLSTATHAHLYKNNNVPSHFSAVGDFIECEFPGYTSMSVTFHPSSLDPDSVPVAVSSLAFWEATTGVEDASETAYGVYLTKSGSTFVGAEAFADPINLANEGDYVAKYISVRTDD